MHIPSSYFPFAMWPHQTELHAITLSSCPPPPPSISQKEVEEWGGVE